MDYLLDTNVVSELRRKSRCDPNVAKWQAGVLAESCFVSVISLTEIVQGIESARKKDAGFAGTLEEWYRNQVIPGFSRRILPVTLEISEQAGAVLAMRTRNLADSLIAATALIHGLTLVTRNVEDFSDTGVPIFNPWNLQVS